MKRQVKKTAVITGAAGGLGKAMALECAGRGYDLILTDINALHLESLADGICRQYPVQVSCYPCDLTDPAALQSFWGQAAAGGRQVNLLINVAGVDYEGEFIAVGDHLLNQIVRLNIESVISMTQQALRHRAPGERMHIINVASLAAFYPMPFKAVYSASKRFLLNLSLALGRELAGENVRIIALCPAGMPTNEDCIRSIRAQGLAGTVTTLGTGTIAHRCLNRALAGHKIYVPGILNLGLRLASLVLPQTLLARIIYRRWSLCRNHDLC